MQELSPGKGLMFIKHVLPYLFPVTGDQAGQHVNSFVLLANANHHKRINAKKSCVYDGIHETSVVLAKGMHLMFLSRTTST